ncbi:MAG: IS21-like element helper ATPase IstB [Candidatus Paceibacterales bacterium]
MSNNATLFSLLKTLRFNGMLTHFDELIEVAELKKMNGIEFLQQFLETEIGYRQTRSLAYRLELAKLPQMKSLDNFDCRETPLDAEHLKRLAQCQFVEHHYNLLFIGGSGSGKTHLALALAYAALQNRYRVKFYLFSDLARHLLQAKARQYEANFMARLQRFHVVVIDEMGYLPIDQQAGSLLFELFSKLYEKTSLIITTHLTFDEGAPLFGNAKTSKAMIDRITHHCTILETGNISWRLKEGTTAKK